MLSRIVVRRRLCLLSAFFVTLFTAGCSTQKVTTETFKDMNRLETEFRRGISTKADIERALGAPNGTGHAVLPNDHMLRDLWYYEDTEFNEFRTLDKTFGSQTSITDVRQKVLVIFFENEVFDGFMWYATDRSAVEK